MRAVIYARYSSENQREASIEDQVRICTARITAEGWTLVQTYADYAQSGASHLRPGYQKLLADGRANAFDVVVAEALDRLSRDQEHVAALFKQLSFAGARILTLAEGEISELHVGLKGTMNALFLKDLALKIRRGLEGRVRQGHSGGGLGYGYEVVRDMGPSGEIRRGNLSIIDSEASVVSRIFTEYNAGHSPRAIAASLNKEGVPGPTAKAWSPSTIYGNWRRGTGILNNELYRGRRVWNRQKFVKDPATGKRVTRYNSPDQVVVQDVPALRIVSEETWQSTKNRQHHIREHVLSLQSAVHAERARRPNYLLSGLIHCGVCGGGFSKRSDTQYACSTAHDRGTCSNRLRIRRDILEASVLSGLRSHLMHPVLVREFVVEYHREIARLNSIVDGERDAKRRKVEQMEREVRAIIDAIKSGCDTPGMRKELMELEVRKERIAQTLREFQPAPVYLNTELGEVYRRKVSRLRDELNCDDVRDEAAQILRSLINEIRLFPKDGELEIELVGNLDALLAFGSKSPRHDVITGARITLVAGEGVEPPTLGL